MKTHPLDHIAKVCHEANRAYCQSLGDTSQPAWEDAPEWQRESARMGVDLHLSGDFGPEASHINWMRQKQDDGWTYGPEKNAELKQHPCMVPYADLPREQQAKDYIFRAIVHALRPEPLLATIKLARDAAGDMSLRFVSAGGMSVEDEADARGALLECAEQLNDRILKRTAGQAYAKGREDGQADGADE